MLTSCPPPPQTRAKQIGMGGIRKAKFKLEHGRDWWILGSASVVAGWHCSWCVRGNEARPALWPPPLATSLTV